MRGIDATQSAVFSYISPEQRIPKDHPLRRIRPPCEIALKALSREFDRIGSAWPLGRVRPPGLLTAALAFAAFTGGQLLSEVRNLRHYQFVLRIQTRRA